MYSSQSLTPLGDELKRGSPDYAPSRHLIEQLRTGPERRRTNPPLEATHPRTCRGERPSTRHRIIDRDGVQSDPLQHRAERLRRIQKEVKGLIIARPDPPGRCPHRQM